MTQSLQDELPLSYPHMQSVARTASEDADRKLRVYINAMVSERIKKEMECQRQVQISRAVCISLLIRRHRTGYLGNVKFQVKSHSGNAAKLYVFINKRKDTRLDHGEFLQEVESEADIQSIEVNQYQFTRRLST